VDSAARKIQAEALRLGLVVGLYTVEDAIAWADTVITEEPAPHASVIDVALASKRSLSVVISLLAQIPGEPHNVLALRSLLACLLNRLKANSDNAETIARDLYHLARTAPWPEEEFGGEAFWLDHTFELLREGLYRGTYADAVADLTSYLERNSRKTA
jgi:hypothetical protein